MLNRLALASLASIALAGAAVAADLPARRAAPVVPLPPVFTWTGFYFGTHTGYVSTENDIRTSGNAANTIANVAANRRPADLSNDGDGFFSGGQVGYNVQFGAFVAGIEADLSYVGLSSRTAFLSSVGDPSAFKQNLDFFGTVRGRLGFAIDRVFIYATGGLAAGDVTYRANFFRNTDGALQFTGRSSDTEVGYAVGGGIEWALPAELQRFAFIGNLLGASAVTLKAEYLYFDLGDRNVIVDAIPGVGVNSYTSNFETKGHMGKIGFNYKFGT